MAVGGGSGDGGVVRIYPAFCAMPAGCSEGYGGVVRYAGVSSRVM